MSNTQMMQNTDNNNWQTPAKWAGSALLLALMGGGLVLGWSGSGDKPLPPPPAPIAAPVVTSVPVPVSAATISAGQQAAAKAVVHQLGARQLSGSLTERPDFVSPIEWQALQGVASQSADHDHELTRLVNKLRFSKQLDLWRSLGNSSDVAQRHALATQLLADIPARVGSKEMDFTEAQKLQGQLLDDLINDPQQRKLRAGEESKKLMDFYVTEGSASGK